MVLIRAGVLCTAILVLASCGGGGGSDSGSGSGSTPTATPVQTQAPSTSPTPTLTPVPTNTPQPTVTPTPTNEPGDPAPDSEPTPTPYPGYTHNPHEERFFGDQDLSAFYEFFDHDNFVSIEVDMTQQNWDTMMAVLIDNINHKRYFPADVTITTESGATTMEDVGFRIRGNWTRKFPEVVDANNNQTGQLQTAHFKIKFNETFDMVPDSLEYLVRKERRFANLRAINLKHTTMSNDTTRIREAYAYDLFNQIGIWSSLTSHANLVVNIGDNLTGDYGLYTMIEPVDKTFLRKRFGDINNEGNLYKCLWKEGGPASLEVFDENDPDMIGLESGRGGKPTYDLKTNKSSPDHSQMVDFVNNINSLEGAAFKNYIDQNFEIDYFLRWLAMNVLVGMPDDFWGNANNYYLYFVPNGKVQFIPWDYDHTFERGWSPQDMSQISVYTWWDGTDFLEEGEPGKERPLIDKIFTIDDYVATYEGYLRQYIEDGIFSTEAFTAKFEQRRVVLDPDLNGLIEFGDVRDVTHGMSMDAGTDYPSIQTYIEARKLNVISELP